MMNGDAEALIRRNNIRKMVLVGLLGAVLLFVLFRDAVLPGTNGGSGAVKPQPAIARFVEPGDLSVQVAWQKPETTPWDLLNPTVLDVTSAPPPTEDPVEIEPNIPDRPDREFRVTGIVHGEDKPPVVIIEGAGMRREGETVYGATVVAIVGNTVTFRQRTREWTVVLEE